MIVFVSFPVSEALKLYAQLINDNGLSTSVPCEPTVSHNYLLNSSSHLQHVKNAIPFQ